jgi:hypothetical protein
MWLRTTLTLLLLISQIMAPTQTSAAESIATPLADSLAGLQAIEAMLATSAIAETPVDRAEASMYLAKNLSHYLRERVIYADPREPRLIYNPGFGFPNPDNLYLSTTRLDPAGSYRIWGQLGTVRQSIFGVYANSALEGESGARARIRGEDLKTDRKGNFELYLSAEKIGENWLPLAEDVASMTIYQIYSDWNTEHKGKLMIERLDTQDAPSADQAQVSGLDKHMAWFLELWTKITRKYHGGMPDNTITPPRRIQVTYLGSQFATGHWNLDNDEALIIEFEDPGATYWGFSFYQPWGELLDIATRQASLNHTQAYRDDDGKYRLVVTEQDPGVANWIDISGHRHGVFNWRVTADQAPEKPDTRVVPVAELARHLPASTRSVTSEERRQVLIERRRHLARRLSP